MAEVTKPIALDESLNTTESTSRNIADVLAEGLDNIAEAVLPRAATEIPIQSGSSTNTKDYIDSKTAYASDITSQTTWLNSFDVAAWGSLSVLKSSSMVVITFLGLKCANAVNDFTNALQLPSAVNGVYSVLRGGDGTVIPIRTTGQYLQVGISVVGTTYTGQIVIPL